MATAKEHKRACDDAGGLRALLTLHEVALDTMSHGLCMFDAEYRVVLFNRRYLEMFNLSPEVVRPGIGFRDVLAHSAARGNFPVSAVEAKWRERRNKLLRGNGFRLRQQLPTGATVELNFRPMADGGWVSVYEDVSAAQRMEYELRLQIERLDQAFTHMSHGLCLFDGAERLVVCNERYLQIYGLDAAIVRPGITFREILAHAVAIGNHRDLSADQLYAKRIAMVRERAIVTQPLALDDGRVIETTIRPIGDGGWVADHEDVTARLRYEEALREQNMRFDAAIGNMAHGLSMFDADERLIVCNAQYLRLYNLDPVVVKPGITHRELVAHSRARGNCAAVPVEEFHEQRLSAAQQGKSLTVRIVAPDGRVIEATSRPTPEGGWVMAHEDITRRLRQEDRLREQNLRFDAALKNMAQGICMFDAEQRLIVRNDQVMSICNLDPEVVKPGATLREIFENGVARGNYPNTTVDQLLEDRLARLATRQTTVLEREIAGGRIVASTLCPMPNGGWVGTFEDVTEARKLEAERAGAIGELRQQNLRFDAALNNMSHGLCMYDEDRRVIVFNQRFLDLFGMSAEVIRPGISLRDVMEHSAAVGNYPGRTAEELYADYIAQLKAGNPTMHRQLADGRVIQVVHRPMPQGGWVATYEDVTERLKTEERISHMARHDALTGLPNRVLFREKMADGLARVEQHGASMAVLCLDLDNFKAVNDTLGHPIGDRLLSTVAQRLICVLDQDDTIARLGGDEFAILQGDPQPEAAEALARRIVEVLSQPVVIDEHEINTGVSIGIAVAPNDGMAADHLMKCADLALYRAKAEGRARYRFFEQDMDTRLREKRALELDLRKALANGEFDLVYQPQVRASDSELTGMEALLRWTRAERGPVTPAEFIPIAEETGLIVPLGEWVLRRACAEAARWPGAIKVAVNLSPVQFKGRGLVATVASALAAAGLPAQRLELEITEAVLLQDDDMTLAMLHQLRALGVRISMDDFGTGYSSLSYLRSFPFDKIKIDRRFISDLERGKDSAAIVRAVAGLGASLGIETTAEGVETAEQLELVRRDGCTEVQGFFFSPPRSAAEVLASFGKLEPEKAVA